MRLKNKVSIVTGAARGIGEACARVFAAEGSKVVLADVLPEEIEANVAAIRKAGGDAIAVPCDVSRPDDVSRLVKAALDEFGRIDACVSNAGISRPKPFLDLSLADWDAVLKVNLYGSFHVGQAVARAMVERGAGGAIVNMSSVNAVVAIDTIAPYCASKGGINQLTKAMAIGLAPHGIRVNGIGPGSIYTDMVKAMAADPTMKRTQLSRTPLGRYGEAEEVARVALFLVSEDSSYVTGQVIYPDGGRLALNYLVKVQDDSAG